MARTRVQRMSTPRAKRMFKPQKPYIVVFCEGDSEKVYMEFMKNRFADVAVIKCQTMANFKDALSILEKSPTCKNNLEITDEVWFFFDAENDKASSWPEVEKILRKVSSLRGSEKIRTRLLMTTGCVEYWFLLHFERCAPSISTKETKETVEKSLQQREKNYKKGDRQSTYRIAQEYETAIPNGEWSLERLRNNGLPCIEDCPERNQWLFQGLQTFTTVHEALSYLKSLSLERAKSSRA